MNSRAGASLEIKHQSLRSRDSSSSRPWHWTVCWKRSYIQEKSPTSWNLHVWAIDEVAHRLNGCQQWFLSGLRVYKESTVSHHSLQTGMGLEKTWQGVSGHEASWHGRITKWQAFRRKTIRCRSSLLCCCQVVFSAGATLVETMPGGRLAMAVPTSAGQVPKAWQSIPMILSSFTYDAGPSGLQALRNACTTAFKLRS